MHRCDERIYLLPFLRAFSSTPMKDCQGKKFVMNPVSSEMVGNRRETQSAPPGSQDEKLGDDGCGIRAWQDFIAATV